MKKILLKIGAVVTAITPVVFAVSCAKNDGDFDLSFAQAIP